MEEQEFTSTKPLVRIQDNSDAESDSTDELAKASPVRPAVDFTSLPRGFTVRRRGPYHERLASHVDKGSRPATMSFPQGHPPGPPSEWRFDARTQATLAKLDAEFVDNGPVATEDSELYCICRCPEDSRDMIECSNGDLCLMGWFHIDCVGVIELPPEEEDWFCPRCIERRIGKAAGNRVKARKLRSSTTIALRQKLTREKETLEEIAMKARGSTPDLQKSDEADGTPEEADSLDTESVASTTTTGSDLTHKQRKKQKTRARQKAKKRALKIDSIIVEDDKANTEVKSEENTNNHDTDVEL